MGKNILLGFYGGSSLYNIHIEEPPQNYNKISKKCYSFHGNSYSDFKPSYAITWGGY